MADQLFSTSPYGKALFNTYGARRPTLAVLGDSYGAFLSTAIQYACARYYAADIDFDHRPAASGGRLFSVGGSPSSHVPGTQIPQFQANPADVAFIWTGYNTAIHSLAIAHGVAADIISAANASGVVGGYSHDNVHPSAHAVRAGLAPIVRPILERIARRRLPRASINSGQFDPVGKPDINLPGDAGSMTGTSGQLNSVSNSNVAGTSYARWNIIPSGGVTATPSIVTGADVFLRQRSAAP